MENEIIHFIDDSYTEYTQWFTDNIQKLDNESYNIFVSIHSDILYEIYDDIKRHIRNNYNNLNLSNYNKDLISFLIPNKDVLVNCICDKLLLSDTDIDQLWDTIKTYVIL